jgi:hypothetical protein
MRRIRKKLDDVTTKLSLWLKEDQHSIWEYALEVCGRVSGANLSPEQCLEYMAGEFLATWAFEANRVDELSDESSESRSANSKEQPGLFDPDTWSPRSRRKTAQTCKWSWNASALIRTISLQHP